ncbi:MAG TPA: transposase [Streptosporangiaceae bacterium]|jgi:IS5 family transposase|nr:transposase [Streptosporangiaceae bacterium]
MQGTERADRQLLDAAALAGHLVPEGSMFAFLAAHRAEIFPDEDYADLFAPPGVGRPSIPATQMAAVLTLQALHDYSDREAAESARFDVRWKVAIGASLDDAGFDPSSLVYWRRRLARSGRPHRVNDAVRKVIGETGILKGRRRRAVDSTILDDAVATQDTVTQLISAIRRVGREVPGAKEKIAAACTGHDYSKPGKPEIDWDDPQAKDALVSALVNDANAVVEAFKDAELGDPAASALALLALVAGQDVEPAEGNDGTDGRWRIARKVAEDRVISVVDPDARHTRKSRQARRDGYRAHVATEPGTGIITDEKLTKASGEENSDPAVAEEFLAAETAGDSAGAAPGAGGSGSDHGSSAASGGDGDRLAWYGDSAYGTGELRDAIGKAGHRAVIKPKPLRPAVEGGFTAGDFTVDEQAGTLTCPAGVTRLIPPGRHVVFGAACRACPLRSRCTTSKSGRAVSLHPRDHLLRAARAAWASGSGLREDYARHRPNVERAIAQVATWRGRRLKLRYRGVASNHAWLKPRTAALNLRTLIGNGLARHGGAWVLAT